MQGSQVNIAIISQRNNLMATPVNTYMGVQGAFDLQRVQHREPLAESSQTPFERFCHREDQHWPHGIARITPLLRRRDILKISARNKILEADRPEIPEPGGSTTGRSPPLSLELPFVTIRLFPVTLFFYTCWIPFYIYDRPDVVWNSPLCLNPLPLGRLEIWRLV